MRPIRCEVAIGEEYDGKPTKVAALGAIKKPRAQFDRAFDGLAAS